MRGWDTGRNLGRLRSKQFLDIQLVGTSIRFGTEKPARTTYNEVT